MIIISSPLKLDINLCGITIQVKGHLLLAIFFQYCAGVIEQSNRLFWVYLC